MDRGRGRRRGGAPGGGGPERGGPRARPFAAPAHARRVRRAGAHAKNPRHVDRGRAPARRGPRPRAVLRAAGTGQDLARPYHRARARRQHALDLGAGDRARRRPRRDRQRPGRGRRAVHRRDSSPRPPGRRGALPGDGGLRAQHRGRQGDGRAHDAAGGEAVYPGRRDHALGTVERAAARSLRPALPSGFLRPRRADRDRRALGAAARRSSRRRRSASRSRAARAARRASPTGCCAACATSPRSTRPPR